MHSLKELDSRSNLNRPSLDTTTGSVPAPLIQGMNQEAPSLTLIHLDPEKRSSLMTLADYAKGPAKRYLDVLHQAGIRVRFFGGNQDVVNPSAASVEDGSSARTIDDKQRLQAEAILPSDGDTVFEAVD